MHDRKSSLRFFRLVSSHNSRQGQMKSTRRRQQKCEQGLTGDLVFAFQDGGFEVGPKTAVASVPEPSSIVLLCVGILGTFQLRRMS